MRDIPNGADVGKVSFSTKKTGSAFPVNATMFSLDLCLKRSAPLRKKLSV